MIEQLNEPENRLSKEAVKIWTITEILSSAVGIIILFILFYLDYRFSWKDWAGWILIALAALLVLVSIWSIFIRPTILYTHWRYGVTEEFLQLKSGTLSQVNQIIPMAKIQTVSTKQGPLLRKYGMYAVTVKTMGSSHTIPILPQDVAVELRNQIAHFAKIKEVDE